MDKSRVVLPGTERVISLERSRLAPVRIDKELTVTITLRGKNGSTLRPLHYAERGTQKGHLKVNQAVRAFSHSARDESAVRRFAREYHLRCTAKQPAEMELRGTAGQMNRAFGVRLFRYTESKYGSKYQGHEEEITLPAYLNRVVCGVFGLDTRPAARRPGLTQRMTTLGIKPPPI